MNGKSIWTRGIGFALALGLLITQLAIGAPPSAATDQDYAVHLPAFTHGVSCVASPMLAATYNFYQRECVDDDVARGGTLTIGGSSRVLPVDVPYEIKRATYVYGEPNVVASAETGIELRTITDGTLTVSVNLVEATTSNARLCLALFVQHTELVARTCTVAPQPGSFSVSAPALKRDFSAMLILESALSVDDPAAAPAPFAGRVVVSQFRYQLPGASFTSPSTATLPNLRPVRPWWTLGTADPGTGSRAIRVSTGGNNIGGYPLDLLGAVPRDGSQERYAVQQCVSWVTSKGCTERRDIGDFVYHPDHQHWHFVDFTKFELRRLQDGLPVMTDDGLVASSGKVSFCIVDGTSPEYSRKNYRRTAPYSIYMQSGGHCTGVLQGLSPGWMDIYEYWQVGQQIVIDGVAKGQYGLVITSDPQNRIFESNEHDNVYWTTLTL